MKSRICVECGEEKALRAFHKKQTGKYGVSPKCKKCTKLYSQLYNQKNADKIKAYNAEYNNRPEVIIERRKRNAKRYDDPGALEKQRGYDKTYRSKPEKREMERERKRRTYQESKINNDSMG